MKDVSRQRRGRAFACISLDLSLGRRSGIDVLSLVAACAPRTPVVIISGGEAGIRAEAVDVARRLELNAHEPLPKPVNLGELRTRPTHIKLRAEAGLAPPPA